MIESSGGDGGLQMTDSRPPLSSPSSATAGNSIKLPERIRINKNNTFILKVPFKTLKGTVYKRTIKAVKEQNQHEN